MTATITIVWFALFIPVCMIMVNKELEPHPWLLVALFWPVTLPTIGIWLVAKPLRQSVRNIIETIEDRRETERLWRGEI